MTMNLNEAKALARALMDAHGLSHWKLAFHRRKRQLALCHHGKKTIYLSRPYVELNDENSLRDTVLHEIAHALVGPGHGHDLMWMAKAAELGARPEACDDVARMPDGKYQATCDGCGRTHHSLGVAQSPNPPARHCHCRPNGQRIARGASAEAIRPKPSRGPSEPPGPRTRPRSSSVGGRDIPRRE
jgi:predicted SprT family Zn-dependent metalloprotease